MTTDNDIYKLMQGIFAPSAPKNCSFVVQHAGGHRPKLELLEQVHAEGRTAWVGWWRRRDAEGAVWDPVLSCVCLS